MTTTVTVSAHCDPETEQVQVQIDNALNEESPVYLADGETREFLAYDDRVITVSEVKKQQTCLAD